MMMDHQPFITDPLEQVGRKDTGFDRSFTLSAGQILSADHPPQVTGDLHLHLVSSKVMENVLLKISTHESRTEGQPDRNDQPGWMHVTYS